MSSDIRRFTRRNIGAEDLEKIFNDLTKGLRNRERPIVIRIEGLAEMKEERTPNVNEQIFRLDSEMQKLRNQVNKYLKIETREESIYHFSELISKIHEINEVYAFHESNGIIFWIFYDRGDRIDVLEKIVDVECDFEQVFANLNYDYRILPFSDINSRIISRGELIYKRGE